MAPAYEIRIQIQMFCHMQYNNAIREIANPFFFKNFREIANVSVVDDRNVLPHVSPLIAFNNQKSFHGPCI